MLKLAIAFLAVVAVLSTVVTAFNQVLQSILPFKWFWLRRGMNVLVGRLGLIEEGGKRNRLAEILGLGVYFNTGELMRDPRVNPTQEWLPGWIDGPAARRWMLDVYTIQKRDPHAWIQDEERFHAWWKRVEEGQTHGYRRMLLLLSAGVGVLLCLWLHLDPFSLAQALQEDDLLVSKLVAEADAEASEPGFETYLAAFEPAFDAAADGVPETSVASAAGSLAGLYFRTASESTFAGRAAQVTGAFEALRARRVYAGPQIDVLSTARDGALSVIGAQAEQAHRPVDPMAAMVPGPTVDDLLLRRLFPEGAGEPDAGSPEVAVYVLWQEAGATPGGLLAALATPETALAAELSAADLDRAVSASRTAWQEIQSVDTDPLGAFRDRSNARVGGMVLMGLLIGFGAPFWFDLLSAIIAGMRGRGYTGIRHPVTPPEAGDGQDGDS